MIHQILIVEDQALIAMSIESAVVALGHEVVGIASSRRDADKLAGMADIAFVDVNLLDGPTGPDIGRDLAQRGCSVIFMTGNPECVENGIEGAIGVIPKPVGDLDLVGVIRYASARLRGTIVPPPGNLRLFA